jgi:phosphatidylglycerophosphate synthase
MASALGDFRIMHCGQTQYTSKPSMPESTLPPLIIIADFPEALTELCGVSLLERMRRTARQIGFRSATILSNSDEQVRAHMETGQWHLSDVLLKYARHSTPNAIIDDVLGAVPPNEHNVLIVFANFFCENRLLRAIALATRDCALIDSNPPENIGELWDSDSPLCAALVSSSWLSERNRSAELLGELKAGISAGRLATVDAAQQPAYVADMRRNIRPVFFPAPRPEQRKRAERLLVDLTQKGVLDFPARVHAPVEKWIVSHLCWTPITPNQVTILTGLLGITVTLLYAFGHFWPGALLALIVGILDGVDGKLARLKVQTTTAGKGEHVMDYCIEMSWWAALAWHFHVSGEIHYAMTIWAAFFVFDVFDRLAKRSVEKRTGRSIDDVSQFDRALRYVAGRRNIYTWLFTGCLLLGTPAIGFLAFSAWGIATAVIHIARALQIQFQEAK